MAERILCTGGSGFIGARLVERLREKPGAVVLNLDTEPPSRPSHRTHWRRADILNEAELGAAFDGFEPTKVVHLAARTDMNGETVADYQVNTTGTRNVLECVRSTPSVERLTLVSSQHVRRPGSGPAQSDEDFAPLGAYGESKVQAEAMTRSARLPCVWTITRPTTVWGPGHSELAAGLWRTLARGLYVHPRNDRVVRGYGFVENVAAQLEATLELPADLVHGRVFYLGDPCMAQFEWVNRFSRAITGRSVRTVPKQALFGLALLGELAGLVGAESPLYLSRYRNLVTSNPVPMAEGLAVLGPGPRRFHEGVEETVAWLREAGHLRS